jgi:SAM-dependent methyltransferase
MPGVSFDRAAEYYDATRGYAAGSAERIRDAIVAHTSTGPDARVLELGVGTGRIALPFIRAGFDFTGIDLSQAMMDRLEAQIAGDAKRATYRLDLRQGDVTALPFPNASFDLVVSVHVVHLVDDWQAMLREARRVLRPGGALVLGYDSAPGDGRPIAGETVPEAVQVRDRWLRLREELGVSRPSGRSNLWGGDERITEFLAALGAHVEQVALTPFERPPMTPREMRERLSARMYSADWSLSDEQHAELLRRLDEWFAQHIAAPDTPGTGTGEFRALVARW